jgi:CHAT domain-containing protein
VTHTRVLAIGQEATPGQSRLPGTKAELSCIAKHVQAPLHYTQITGHDATAAAVLTAMEKNDWVHLACHAHQNRNEPTESGFFLHGGTLSLATVTQKLFKNKGLAFLSACQTARGDENLADEAVHLASGMLMAGYPSVIATMWSVMDADAPVVADKVYAQLLKDGKMNNKDAAKALHEAVGELREKVGEDAFARWVPYIHMGV